MEGKYIFALIILGLFFLLIFVSFALIEYGRIKDDKLQVWIKERYADKNLNKFDYDTIVADEEEIMRTIPDAATDTNENKEETVEDSIQPVPEKIDIEGIEEITGNYDGNKL